MALRIRLRRMGRKKSPHYRIVVAESSMPRDGRFVEIVGHYNPTTQPETLVVDRDKALSWVGKGATPSETVNSLFKRAGVYKPAPTMVESMTETVKETAKKASKSVKAAAAAVAETVTGAVETVVEKVSPAVDAVVEKVTPAVEAVMEKVSPPAEETSAAEETPAADEAPAAEATAEAPASEPATEEQAG